MGAAALAGALLATGATMAAAALAVGVGATPCWVRVDGMLLWVRPG